jgi:hypothetical protein
MHPVLRPKNLLIGVLGAAVVGLGTVVVVDRTAAPAPAAQTAHNAPAPANLASLNVSSLLAAGEFGSVSSFKGGQALNVFNFFTTDTKLTWQQIGADLLKGETLDQIAGANASKVEKDALAEVRAGLTLGVTHGVITAAQENRLLGDAQDAISVLMAAKLSALLPAGH